VSAEYVNAMKEAYEAQLSAKDSALSATQEKLSESQDELVHLRDPRNALKSLFRKPLARARDWICANWLRATVLGCSLVVFALQFWRGWWGPVWTNYVSPVLLVLVVTCLGPFFQRLKRMLGIGS
jgi:hypothetical protein